MDCNQTPRRGLDVVANVKDAKSVDEGYSAATDTYEDLMMDDVVDAVKVVRQALPERFVHRFPAAGHRNDRRGDPRKEAGIVSDTGDGIGGMYSVLSYTPSVVARVPRHPAKLQRRTRAPSARPRFQCFLASVPMVRGSVM
jgi:hypothetical protein